MMGAFIKHTKTKTLEVSHIEKPYLNLKPHKQEIIKET
jgi:hypothetical protein